jgi:hypothetical protein
VQTLRAQLKIRPDVTKDMSLVLLLPKWTGIHKEGLLNEFFEATDIAAIGKWSDAHKVQLAILRLVDSTTAFYDGTRELDDRNISWADFKAIFKRCFRDVKSNQYHFTQLKPGKERT